MSRYLLRSLLSLARALTARTVLAIITIPTVPAAFMIFALSLFRVGQTKGEDFVVSGSTDFAVTRSPIEGAVYDRWAIDDRAPAREAPQNVPSCRVEGVHLP